MSNCCGDGYYQKSNKNCPDIYGCDPSVCPNLTIKRHDTYPPFVVSASDCNGPIDLTDTVVEVSMWANGKFKEDITDETEEFSLTGNIGYYQSFIGDIIIPQSTRSLEMMLVTGYDEVNKKILVTRGYHGTTPISYKKNTPLRMFRFLNALGQTEVVKETVEGVDGIKKVEISDARLIYNWKPNDTCLPGCYFVEFKLLKMFPVDLEAEEIAPSVTFCSGGVGVEWSRRFPLTEGFVVQIVDSFSSEQTVIA